MTRRQQPPHITISLVDQRVSWSLYMLGEDGQELLASSERAKRDEAGRVGFKFRARTAPVTACAFRLGHDSLDGGHAWDLDTPMVIPKGYTCTVRVPASLL